MRWTTMQRGLGADLTPEEFKSLQELDKGLMRRIIPDRHRKRLVDLGFAREGTGGVVLTDAGKMRIAVGK
jgi:hypothetical protein